MLPLEVPFDLAQLVCVVKASVVPKRLWIRETVIGLRLRIMWPESPQLAQLFASKCAGWVHKLHVWPLKVANDELVETAQLGHT